MRAIPPVVKTTGISPTISMKPAVQLPTVYSKNGGYAPYVGTSDISAIANRNGGNILKLHKIINLTS